MWIVQMLKSPIYAVLALGLFLAGCNMHPVYGPNGGYGIDHVTQELAAVDVDKAPDRITLEMRNRLIFKFNRGRSVTDKRYKLSYTLAQSDDAVVIGARTGAPSSYRLSAVVRYQLVDLQTGDQITAGTVRVSSSYDRSSQSFANIRARRDAENRAATTAADEITARLSTYFTTNRQ